MKKLFFKVIIISALGLAVINGCDLFDDIRVAIEMGAQGNEAFLPPAGFTIPGMEGTTSDTKELEETADDDDNNDDNDSGGSSGSSDDAVYFSINFDTIEGFDLKNIIDEELDNLQKMGVPIPDDTYSTETGVLNLTRIPSPPGHPEIDPAKQLAIQLKKALARISDPAQFVQDFPPDDPKVTTTMMKCKKQDIFKKDDDGNNILSLLLPADIITPNKLDPSGQLEAYKGIIDQIRITETELLFEGYDDYALKKGETKKSPAEVNTLSYPLHYAGLLVFDVSPTKAGGDSIPRFYTPTTNELLTPSEIPEPVDPICQGSRFLFYTDTRHAAEREESGVTKWVENKDYVTLLEIPRIEENTIPPEDVRIRKFTLEELHSINDTLKKLNFQIAFQLDIDLTNLIDDLDRIIVDKGDKRPDLIRLPVGGVSIRLRYHAFFVTCPQEAALGSNKAEDIKCAE